MSPGLLKALFQTTKYFFNWRKSDPDNATRHGRKYLGLVLIAGLAILTVLYQQGIAVPTDFGFFTGGLFLIDILDFGTVLRIAMAIDPVTGGILGMIGLGALAKFFRDLGSVSAAIKYFNSLR